MAHVGVLTFRCETSFDAGKEKMPAIFRLRKVGIRWDELAGVGLERRRRPRELSG